MKILLRYLFVALLQAFIFCAVACLFLPFIFDLFSSLNEFLQNRSQYDLLFSYYEAFFPYILPMVLPPALLFATLYTLLSMNRTSQLVAMQAGGISAFTLFTPFLGLGLVATLILYGISLTVGGSARARQREIMNTLRNPEIAQGMHQAQVYRNRASHRTWYAQTLNPRKNNATGLDVADQDDDGRDAQKVFARSGSWDGNYWTFQDALVVTYNPDGTVASRQIYENLPEPDWHESPKEMVRILLRPDEMTVADLRHTLHDGDVEAARSAPYRTRLWELFFSPLIGFILIGFALPQGLQYGRRDVSSGVFNAIFLLLAFYIVWNFFLALGAGGRLPAPLAVIIPILGFAGLALWRLAPHVGWRLPAK
ncbi:MAG: LptF/LptG family permease [Verrucomicrobium sp.]|nr:LptF/LptG family permease [Verrucomicrobium sp.]